MEHPSIISFLIGKSSTSKIANYMVIYKNKYLLEQILLDNSVHCKKLLKKIISLINTDDTNEETSVLTNDDRVCELFHSFINTESKKFVCTVQQDFNDIDDELLIDNNKKLSMDDLTKLLIYIIITNPSTTQTIIRTSIAKNILSVYNENLFGTIINNCDAAVFTKLITCFPNSLELMSHLANDKPRITKLFIKYLLVNNNAGTLNYILDRLCLVNNANQYKLCNMFLCKCIQKYKISVDTLKILLENPLSEKLNQEQINNCMRTELNCNSSETFAYLCNMGGHIIVDCEDVYSLCSSITQIIVDNKMINIIDTPNCFIESLKNKNMVMVKYIIDNSIVDILTIKQGVERWVTKIGENDDIDAIEYAMSYLKQNNIDIDYYKIIKRHSGKISTKLINYLIENVFDINSTSSILEFLITGGYWNALPTYMKNKGNMDINYVYILKMSTDLKNTMLYHICQYYEDTKYDIGKKNTKAAKD